MARQSFVKIGALFLLGLALGFLYEFLLHGGNEHDLKIDSLGYANLWSSSADADAKVNCDCEEVPVQDSQSVTGDDPKTEKTEQGSDTSGASHEPRLLNCSDLVPEFRMEQHDKYYVLYNAIPARKWFHCDETITFATHGELNFLHNLMNLTTRWQGPVSVAVYAPASDYDRAMHVVKYLRDCTTAGDLIKDLVTFHFFFPRNHVSEFFPTVKWKNINGSPLECALYSDDAIFLNKQDLYRVTAGLTYPVNVARNIAKEGTTTMLALHADIELLPSLDLVPKFLDLLRRKPELVLKGVQTKSVFVVLSYSLQSKIASDQVPRVKAELLFLLERVRAYLHKSCKSKKCPLFNAGYKGWMKVDNETDVSVVATIKRPDPYWSPFYISFNTVPFCDERFGVYHHPHGTQVASLCLLDYDFHILDGAFLVQTVGTKRHPSLKINKEEYFSILREVEPEMYWLFGENPDCLPDELHKE